MEKEISDLISKTISSLGFQLLKISITGTKNKIVKVFLERLDGLALSINDCKTVSNNIAPLIDVEGIIKEQYVLEVSSTGNTVYLNVLDDFLKFIGNNISLNLSRPIKGKKIMEGKLIDASMHNITIAQKGFLQKVKHENIENCRLL